jgi:hypothetical protein
MAQAGPLPTQGKESELLREGKNGNEAIDLIYLALALANTSKF